MTQNQSSKDAAKKAEEVNYFRLACLRLGEQWELVDGSGELPDLRVLVEGRRIGVEVTTIDHDGDARKEARSRARIVQKARLFYQRNHADPLRVQVAFQLDVGHIRLNKKRYTNGGKPIRDDQAFAKELADFVAEVASGAGTFWAIEHAQLPEELRRFLAAVYVDAAAGSDEWRYISAGSSAHYSSSRIQSIIDDKHENMEKYQQAKLDAYWLLIVAPTDIGCAEDMTNEDLAAIAVQSRFERVIFMGWLCCAQLHLMEAA